MVCIYNPTDEQIDALNYYEDVLGSEDAAYYVLSQNNGYPLYKTPFGEDSDLYNDLVAWTGDENTAVKIKAMMYTDTFLKAHGDWTVGTQNDPTMFDGKGEPKLNMIQGRVQSQELIDISNLQFLQDPEFPIYDSDLLNTPPEDDMSQYAIDQLLTMSYDAYVNREQDAFKRQNPTASDKDLTDNRIKASRRWYSKKVKAIMTEQVRALAVAFGLEYVQHQNGSVELRSKVRGQYNMNGLRDLRIKFLNNLVNDPLEDQLRTQILGVPSLGETNTTRVEGAPDYMHDAILRHVEKDRMLAASTMIAVSLNHATATTINKSLAYHYITSFRDSKLIQAALLAVDDGNNRSQIYLINKLVDVITSPSISGVEGTSMVEKSYKEGTKAELELMHFWKDFDELLHEVIDNGVRSEQARKKILQVVATAFRLNEDINRNGGGRQFTSVDGTYDYFADWYSTKYKPWGPQHDKQLSEILGFLSNLERSYQNKIKRQERDQYADRESGVRTQAALYKLQTYDRENPIEIEKAIKDLMDTAYVDICDANDALDSLANKSTIDTMAILGSQFNNTISFYNYIIDVQLKPFFPIENGMFPDLRLQYQALIHLLGNLDNRYKQMLGDATEKYVDEYVDKYMDRNVVTDEMIRNAKANLHLELKHSAIFGDLAAYELWGIMNSTSVSGLVRQTLDSIMRLNFNRDQIVLNAAIELRKKLEAAKKAIVKRPIEWGGYAFFPVNFQLLFQERFEDGVPSGMFVRRLAYGKFFRDRKQRSLEVIKKIERQIQDSTGNIHFKMEVNKYGEPVFPEDPSWDKYWRTYEHAMNDYDCTYGHKRYLKEYYDIRIDTLSRDTIAMQEDIQNRIDIILKTVTHDATIDTPTGKKTFKVPHIEELTVSERRRLEELYHERDNLGNEYLYGGVLKTGDAIRMAQEVTAFREKIKGRILYNTDWDKFNAARNSVDPSKQNEFVQNNMEIGVDPKFFEIYNILKEEYKEKLPDELLPNFEHIEQISKEINKIVNTVKLGRFVQPALRHLQDDAWSKIRTLDQQRQDEWDIITQYKQNHPDFDFPVSPFRRLCHLDDVMDSRDNKKVLFQALKDEAQAKDAQESLSLGTPVNTNINEFYAKYTLRVLTPEGHMEDVPLSVFSYMLPDNAMPDDILQRFNLPPTYTPIISMPKQSYNKAVTFDEGNYSVPEEDVLVDPEFDTSEDSYVQPKEVNPVYEMLADPKRTPKEVFELYEFCIELKRAADSFIPSISARSTYKLPQMRASDTAQMSRMFSFGLRRALEPIGHVFTNNFIGNETDDELQDDFTLLPDGTRVNNIPVRYQRDLDDMTQLTSDVVGSLISYYHMAANFHFKQNVAPIYQAILQQLGSNQYVESPVEGGTPRLVIGKTTNLYSKYENVLDSQLYDQPQVLGSRGIEGLTAQQQTVIKTLKFISRVGVLAALARNTISQSAGFIDASLKLESFAVSGEAFNKTDLIYAITTFNTFLLTGKLLSSTGTVLPDNLIAALMQKNQLSNETRHKYSGSQKSKIRRVFGLERAGMAGFRVSDYSINAVLALMFYNNYRYIDNDFLPENSFKEKLRRQGLSSREINEIYGKAPTLLEAYIGKDNFLRRFLHKGGELEMTDEYKQRLGEGTVRRVEQNIMKALHIWAPKVNGAVANEDDPLIKQNILSNFTVALRSFILNEFQTRYAKGRDFQDPNYSERQIRMLKSRRDALAKVYKETYSESKKRTKLDKLTEKKSKLEQEIVNLISNGDKGVIDWQSMQIKAGMSFVEAGVGSLVGSVFGPIGAIVGAVAGEVAGYMQANSIVKAKGGFKNNVVVSKIQKLEEEYQKVCEQIAVYDSSDSKDIIHMQLMDINRQINEALSKQNDNQGYYDYARNIVTNGSNRLTGRLLMNVIRNAYYYINLHMPKPFQTLKATYKATITPMQVRGLKRVGSDLFNIGILWLLTTYGLSFYRYGDARGFMNGIGSSVLNKPVTKVMNATEEQLNNVLSPVMHSDSWKHAWQAIHDSATDGFISDIPISGLDKFVELKADAMLGYDKKVSRKTKEITRIESDPVARQIQFIKAFGALISLKGFTEQVSPYDPQAINDLADAISGTVNVMIKMAEAEQQGIKDQMNGISENPMQSGPYHAYFDRSEYVSAHSWQRPFGFPSAYEQSTTSGVSDRINLLSNTGVNKYVFQDKEPQYKNTKPGKKKGKKKKKLQNW